MPILPPPSQNPPLSPNSTRRPMLPNIPLDPSPPGLGPPSPRRSLPPDARPPIGGVGPFQSLTPRGRRMNPSGGAFGSRGPFSNVFGRTRNGLLGRGAMMAEEDENVGGPGSAMAPDPMMTLMQQLSQQGRMGRGY